MLKRPFAKLLLIIFCSIASFNLWARDYVIYQIEHSLTMGIPDEVMKKNYFVNFGGNHGLKSGTVLDVFRVVSNANPYDNNKRYNFKVRVGQLEVIHSESEAAVAKFKELKAKENLPYLDVSQFMVGDIVAVSLGKLD